MPRILIAELKQETATFNPTLTRYDDFHVHRGDDIFIRSPHENYLEKH